MSNRTRLTRVTHLDSPGAELLLTPRGDGAGRSPHRFVPRDKTLSVFDVTSLSDDSLLDCPPCRVWSINASYCHHFFIISLTSVVRLEELSLPRWFTLVTDRVVTSSTASVENAHAARKHNNILTSVENVGLIWGNASSTWKEPRPRDTTSLFTFSTLG